MSHWLCILGVAASLAASALIWQDVRAGNAFNGYLYTWAEVAGYYLVIIARDVRRNVRPGPWPKLVLVTARNAVLEFGPAELLDTTLIRPAALYAGMSLIPNPVAGVPDLPAPGSGRS